MAERIATSSANMLPFSLHRNGNHQISAGLDYLQTKTGKGRLLKGVIHELALVYRE
jgi:hypothetical protein